MLEEVKRYLRIDGAEDDTFLTSLITAAKEYIKNGSGYPVNESNELHKLAVNLLVTNWYENREPVGQAEVLKFSLESIFIQLKYSYVPPEIPSGLYAKVSNGVVDLSWAANEESDLKGYKVYQNSVVVADIATNSYQISLGAGTYEFQVSAYDKDQNESELSEPVSVVI